MYHKHWIHFLKKIAGGEKLLQKCKIVILFLLKISRNVGNVLENILLKFKVYTLK